MGLLAPPQGDCYERIDFRLPEDRASVAMRANSSAVRRCSAYSASASAASDSSVPASTGGRPNEASDLRPSGYAGKKAARGE